MIVRDKNIEKILRKYEYINILNKKGMSIAKGGFGNIFMMMFTMYMTGSAMNIVTIMIIG